MGIGPAVLYNFYGAVAGARAAAAPQFVNPFVSPPSSPGSIQHALNSPAHASTAWVREEWEWGPTQCCVARPVFCGAGVEAVQQCPLIRLVDLPSHMGVIQHALNSPASS